MMMTGTQQSLHWYYQTFVILSSLCSVASGSKWTWFTTTACQRGEREKKEKRERDKEREEREKKLQWDKTMSQQLNWRSAIFLILLKQEVDKEFVL